MQSQLTGRGPTALRAEGSWRSIPPLAGRKRELQLRALARARMEYFSTSRVVDPMFRDVRAANEFHRDAIDGERLLAPRSAFVGESSGFLCRAIARRGFVTLEKIYGARGTEFVRATRGAIERGTFSGHAVPASMLFLF